MLKLRNTDLINRHRGIPGFILGAGPSLYEVDSYPLQDYITIAVNSGIVKMPNCDYFLSDDIAVKNWTYYLYDLQTSKCIKLLYHDKLKNYACHLRQEEIIWFLHKSWYDPHKNVYNPEGLVLTKGSQPEDFRIIGARCSAGSALHFAYIMGCDPIVLLGCDCCYNKVSEGKPKRYFWQYDDWPMKQPYRVTKEPVFCTPNKGKRKGSNGEEYWLDSHSADFLHYWGALAKQCEKQNVNVINASGGILEAFPRMTLEEVLEKYGSHTRKV